MMKEMPIIPNEKIVKIGDEMLVHISDTLGFADSQNSSFILEAEVMTNFYDMLVTEAASRGKHEVAGWADTSDDLCSAVGNLYNNPDYKNLIAKIRKGIKDGEYSIWPNVVSYLNMRTKYAAN